MRLLVLVSISAVMNNKQRTSFRGTIWEKAIHRANLIKNSGIDETVTCPVPSCRNSNKFFNLPQSLRKHAIKYHPETITARSNSQPNQSIDDEFDYMEVDQEDCFCEQIQILNPAPKPVLQDESFVIVKHKDNPNFQVY